MNELWEEETNYNRARTRERKREENRERESRRENERNREWKKEKAEFTMPIFVSSTEV